MLSSVDDYVAQVAGTEGNPLRLEKKACDACRVSKRACDETRPICGRCLSKSIDCIYSGPEFPGRKRFSKDASTTPTTEEADFVFTQNKQEALNGLDSFLDDSISTLPPGGFAPVAAWVDQALRPQFFLQPIANYGALPEPLDEAAYNAYTRFFFDAIYLKSLGAVVHPQGFLKSLSRAPSVTENPLAAPIMWHGALASSAEQTAIRGLQRLAWRSLMKLRQAFWATPNPSLQLGAEYMSAIVLCQYASWKTLGIGTAKRFHEELVRASQHIGLASLTAHFSSETPEPIDTRDWIAKQTLLYCFWNEAFAFDASLSMATGTEATLDPQEWLELEMPVEADIFTRVNVDEPVPQHVLSLKKLKALDVLGWTFLEPGTEARQRAVQALSDSAVLRQDYGLFWGTVAALPLAQCLSELCKLQKW